MMNFEKLKEEMIGKLNEQLNRETKLLKENIEEIDKCDDPIELFLILKKQQLKTLNRLNEKDNDLK